MMSSLVTAAPVRSPRHCAILTPTQGSAFSAPIALNRPVCVVGDRSRVHLVLASPLVSRSHALLVDDSDGLYVRDLASSNGVLVNDQKVGEAFLYGGDQLQVGPFVFRCQVARSAAGDHQPPVLAEIRGDGFAPVRLNDRRTTLIGSRRGCDIRVDGVGVASVHAVIFCRRGCWYIRDLSSEGGTRVLGRLIRESELLGGEQIHIGTVAMAFVRPDLVPPVSGPPAVDAAEQAFEASLLDGVETIEIGPDESAIDGLPTITENWTRQDGFDAPQVTAADLGLDLPVTNSALASASNLQSELDPEGTLMDASRSILTLADLIDMPTGTPEDLGLADEPEADHEPDSRRDAPSPRREPSLRQEGPHVADRRESRSRPAELPEPAAFDHELIGNPEESGVLPQPWALLGIDSALEHMGLGGVSTPPRRQQPPPADLPAVNAEAAEPEPAPVLFADPEPVFSLADAPSAVDAVTEVEPEPEPTPVESLHQLTFLPLTAGWAKCPGCGAAFPMTVARQH